MAVVLLKGSSCLMSALFRREIKNIFPFFLSFFLSSFLLSFLLSLLLLLLFFFMVSFVLPPPITLLHCFGRNIFRQSVKKKNPGEL